jgi:hypothetical protein
VELALADIDPHVGEAGVHVGVARQPEPLDVEQRCLRLVGDLQVDVLQTGDVAEILGLAVVTLCHWRPSLDIAVIARSAGTRQSRAGFARPTEIASLRSH